MEVIKLILIILILIIIVLIFLLTLYDVLNEKKRKKAKSYFDDSEVTYVSNDPEEEKKRATQEYLNMKEELLKEEARKKEEERKASLKKEASLLDGVVKKEPEVKPLHRPSLLDRKEKEIIPVKEETPARVETAVKMEVPKKREVPVMVEAPHKEEAPAKASTLVRREIPIVKEEPVKENDKIQNIEVNDNIKRSTFSSVKITGSAKKEIPVAEDLRLTKELPVIKDEDFKTEYYHNKDKEEAAKEKIKPLINDELFDIVDKELEDLPEYDEDDLIISVKDLESQADEKYAANEKTQYEEDELPISIDELYETRELKALKEEDIAKAKLNDMLPNFGKVDPIELEKTMNLEQVQAEIKKANEYIETLKTLKDNLNRKDYEN